MPKGSFRKSHLLGYVPSIDRAGATIQIFRLTNGRGTLLTDEPGEIRRIHRGKNTGMKMRLFSAALAAKPGIVPFVRLARREGRMTRFAYFPRGDVAHMELLQQAWSEERVLGYVSSRQLLDTLPLYFDPATTALTLAAVGQGIATAATTADAADLHMRNPAEQAEPPGNGITEFLLVPKEVSAKGLRIWVGKLDIAAPTEDRRLNFWDPATRTKADDIPLRASGWKTAVEKPGFNCWYQEVTSSQLSAGKHYSLVLTNEATGAEDAYGEATMLPLSLPIHVPLERWDVDGGSSPRRTTQVSTLASRAAADAPAGAPAHASFVPPHQRQPLKIFAGSCYSRQFDKGRVAHHYAQLYGSVTSRPDLKILLGNQVYLDAPYYRGLLRRMTGGFSSDALADSFLDKYGRTWTELGPLLSLGATCFTTGDHDYWNGYPDDARHLPQLFDSQRRADWEALSTALRDVFQTMRSTHSIEIGNDISVFLFDTRRNRTRQDAADPRFADPTDLLALRNWILRLRGPGIVAGGQLLFDAPPGAESNLRSFPVQYSELCQILAASPHDIVYLCGDVHFGRIAQVQFSSGQKLVEVVTSPMSLVEDDGNYIWDGADIGSQFAKDVWVLGQDVEPRLWPQIPVAGVSFLPIAYLEAVPANQEDPERTEENFMILSFTKNPPAGAIRMKVNCYLPRLQAKSFSRVFELT
jgi:hypothetical protein